FRGEPYPHLGRYARYGGALAGIAAGVLLHPLPGIGAGLTGERLVYLLPPLTPLALLPGFSPRELVRALPLLRQNLLSSDPILYTPRAQYQSFVLPFLIAAAIAGYARMAGPRPARWPVAALVVALVVSLALASRTVNNLAVARWWPSPEQRAAYA